MRSLAWTDKKKKDRKPYRVSRRALRGLREKEFLLCREMPTKQKRVLWGLCGLERSPAPHGVQGEAGEKHPYSSPKSETILN